MDLSWDSNFSELQGSRMFKSTGSYGDKGMKTLPAFRGLSLKDLDGFLQFTKQWASEAFRILKAGGYMLSFGGIKTHDVMTVGFRLAGFEIRDMLLWIYATGFPKGQDISKEFDKVAGVERPKKKPNPNYRSSKKKGTSGFDRLSVANIDKEFEDAEKFYITEPVTPEAKEWNGWRTNLKPAYEPIVMAQKPREGSFIENIQEHKVGALNIDALRIPFDNTKDSDSVNRDLRGKGSYFGKKISEQEKLTKKYVKQDTFWYNTYNEKMSKGEDVPHKRSWEKLYSFDKLLKKNKVPKPMIDIENKHPSPNANKDGKWEARSQKHNYFANPKGRYPTNIIRADILNDGYDRYFYVPKPSLSEKGEYNIHPTCKPIFLMKRLIEMVTVKKQIVLDPFAGSGTTCLAAHLLNRRWIGFEREEKYLQIATRRFKELRKIHDLSGLI